MKKIIAFGLSGKTENIALKTWNFVNRQPNTIFGFQIKDGPIIKYNLKIYKKTDLICMYGPFGEKGNVELKFKDNEKKNFIDLTKSLGEFSIVKPYITIISNNKLNAITAVQK